MFSFAPKVCLFVILAVAAVPVLAEVPIAKAEIPFAFTVNGVSLQAGTYTVEKCGNAGLLAFQQAGGPRVMVMAHRSAVPVAAASRVVFLKAAGAFKLAEVSIGPAAESYLIRSAPRAAAGEKIEISLLRP